MSAIIYDFNEEKIKRLGALSDEEFGIIFEEYLDGMPITVMHFDTVEDFMLSLRIGLTDDEDDNYV